MRTTAAVLILAAIACTPAAAEPCRVGTNMPMSDAVAAKPIDAGQPRVVCEASTLNARQRDGSTVAIRTWNFEVKK